MLLVVEIYVNICWICCFDCILLIQYSVLVCVWTEHSVVYHNTVLYLPVQCCIHPNNPYCGNWEVLWALWGFGVPDPRRSLSKETSIHTKLFSHRNHQHLRRKFFSYKHYTKTESRPPFSFLFTLAQFFLSNLGMEVLSAHWISPRTFVTLKNLSSILLTIPPRNLQL